MKNVDYFFRALLTFVLAYLFVMAVVFSLYYLKTYLVEEALGDVLPLLEEVGFLLPGIK